MRDDGWCRVGALGERLIILQLFAMKGKRFHDSLPTRALGSCAAIRLMSKYLMTRRGCFRTSV